MIERMKEWHSIKKVVLEKVYGKGIDSLISNAYAVETKKKDSAADKKEPETTVKLRLVEPASSQPRLKFDEDTLTELAESIKKYGVIQPIVVKKVEDHYQIMLENADGEQQSRLD